MAKGTAEAERPETQSVETSIDQLAAIVAKLETEEAEAKESLAQTGTADLTALMAAVDRLKGVTNRLGKARREYESAKWSQDNGARVAASTALHDALKAYLPTMAEFTTATGLGAKGFTVRVNEDGSLAIDIAGAKAPSAPRASGTGTGGGGKRKLIRNKHTGETMKSREWLEQYGNEKEQEAARKAAPGNKFTSKNGVTYGTGFQPQLKTALARLSDDWEEIRMEGGESKNGANGE